MEASILNVVSPLTLKDNAVRLFDELDGTEPTQIACRVRDAARKGWRRVAVGINTYYPRLQGGFYRNSALLVLVQQAIARTGLQVVQNELLADGAMHPNELEGVLDRFEEYVVVGNGEIVGDLIVWELSGGGGSDLYRDAIVVDVNLVERIAIQLVANVGAILESSGISVVR